jgi:hypothetical protein
VPLDPRRFDEHKRPVLCKHGKVKKVEAEGWEAECEDCGLRFKKLISMRMPGSGRKPRRR